MPTVNSVNAALNYIQNAIQYSLGNEVLWAVQAEEAEQIEHVVYDAYEPTHYQRRWDMNNLDNIQGTVTDLTLEVENITPLNTYFDPNISGGKRPSTGGTLAEIVESGAGYDFYSPGARPFTEATISALAASSDHVKALKRGLRKAGIKVVK